MDDCEIMLIMFLFFDEGQCEAGRQKRAAAAGVEDARAGARVYSGQAEGGKR